MQPHPPSPTADSSAMFQAPKGRGLHRLGPLLVAAVVFADLGTSVYYTPGILLGRFGALSGPFVLLAGMAFILLADQYAEICARYPEGGGVVAAAADAFGDFAGCVGGMLIIVDYFLTSALSVVIGLHHLQAFFPLRNAQVVEVAAVALLVLGLLNIVGLKEAARTTALLAGLALAANVALLIAITLRMSHADWDSVRQQLFHLAGVSPRTAAVGFAAAWLAYSGVESVAQLAPIVREPRGKTARLALFLVVIAVLATAPLLTTFVTLLPQLPKVHPERLLPDAALAAGGPLLASAVVATSAALLLFAANTALMGSYHVFLALSKKGFLPSGLGRRHRRFGTPHRAILVATVAPILLAAFTRGNIVLLGELYSFGILGAFALASASVSWLRWQDQQRGLRVGLGTIVAVLLAGAWCINLISKWHATLYGGALAGLGVAFGYLVRKGRILVPQGAHTRAEDAEEAAARTPEIREAMILDQALDLAPLERASTLVAVRGPNARLYREAVRRVRGLGERNIYILYVDEVPGLFFPPKLTPTPDALAVLSEAARTFHESGIDAIPIWRMAHDAGDSIAGAVERLGVTTVMVGTSQRTAIWHLLRGNVLTHLVRRLPESTRLLIVN